MQEKIESLKVYLQGDDGKEITLSDIQGYILETKNVKEMMSESSTYQEYMFSLFSMKLTSLATLVEDLKFKPLKQRVWLFLKSKNSKEIEITHEKIAQNLGTSRVVISRVLKQLEKSKKY